MAFLPDYAELHALSNFSFLRGASHPEELVARAHALGYSALALTDECSLAGAVRAHFAAKECGLPLIHGTEIGIGVNLDIVAGYVLMAVITGYLAVRAPATETEAVAVPAGAEVATP